MDCNGCLWKNPETCRQCTQEQEVVEKKLNIALGEPEKYDNYKNYASDYVLANKVECSLDTKCRMKYVFSWIESLFIFHEGMRN